MSADPFGTPPPAVVASRSPLVVEELLLRGRPPAPFSVEDLDVLPGDDGYRYELFDGMLVVSPSPGLAHQRMVGKLLGQLQVACPSEFEVLPGPFDVKPGGAREFAPDLLVSRPGDFGERGIVRPLLVVEVRSPSTRLYDQTMKRAAYAEAGIESYWLVDPLAPSITVLELTTAGYVEVTAGDAADVVRVREPFPVEIRLG
jgi:Uma2 family endonuclease